MLSSISSLSGSALTISTLLFIFNFYPQEGKQIAFFSYLTVSLISFTYNGKNILNPFRSTKALDYNIILVTVPLFICGFVLGDVLTYNEIILYLIIGVCVSAVIILFYFVRFAIRVYFSFTNEIEDDFINKKEDNENKSNHSESEVDKRNLQNDQMRIDKQLQSEKSIIQKDKLRHLFIFFLVFLLFSSMSNIQYVIKYSTVHYMMISFFSLFCILFAYFTNTKVNLLYTLNKSSNYPYSEKDIHYSNHFITRISIVGMISGLICGSTGIDGGILILLFMILHNVHINILYATINTFELVVSFFGFVYYLFEGNFNIGYITIVMISSIIGAMIGNYIEKRYIILISENHYANYSILITILISIIVYPICSLIYLI